MNNKVVFLLGLVIGLLLGKGGLSLSSPIAQAGLSPERLYGLAVEQRTDALDEALKSGYDVNAQDGDGQTALMKAIDRNQSLAAKRLLDRFANPYVRDHQGNTALMRAVDQNRVDAVVQLLEQDRISRTETVNLKNERGENALHIAIRNGNKALVHKLLEYHADLNSRDNSGTTPLMRAAERGAAEVVALLRDRGADITLRDLEGHAADWYASLAKGGERVKEALAPLQPKQSSGGSSGGNSGKESSGCTGETCSKQSENPQKGLNIPLLDRLF